MIVTSSLHNHSTLCDGRSTPEEMVRAAIRAGFTDFGMSGHSYAPFDPECSVRSEAEYITAVRALQKRYSGEIRVWCGIEQDHFAPVANRSAFDYIIGSVHYVQDKRTGGCITIDGSVQDMRRAVDTLFGGDALACAAEYYRLVTETAWQYRPDVIGHFDVITKNNRRGGFFDEADPAYRRAALDALTACAATGAVFEVNTGGMLKGYRTAPYPDVFLLEQLCAMDAPVMLSADCHDAEKLLYGLAETAALLRRIGFRKVVLWRDGRFVEETL